MQRFFCNSNALLPNQFRIEAQNIVNWEEGHQRYRPDPPLTMTLLAFSFPWYRHYHEIATGTALQMVMLAGEEDREEDRMLQTTYGEETYAKQSSDRSGPAPEMRREGNSRRGRNRR
jgi:hypothetical protein